MSQPRSGKAAPRRKVLPSLENLEDRFAPATLTVGGGGTYATIAQAAAAAQNGDTINIQAGTYTSQEAVFTQSNLTIQGVNGRAVFNDSGYSIGNRKGIFDIQGNNVTVRNIEFDYAHDNVGQDKNWAGIRGEGNTLTIQNCYFFHCDDGILINNDANFTTDNNNLTVTGSEFGYNGYGDGQSHNMYIGQISSFTLDHSYTHDANQGHLIKCRALTAYITYDDIEDGATGGGSSEIDLPYGGRDYLIGNTIVKQANAPYHGFVGYDLENGPAQYAQQLYAVNNTFVNNYGGGTYFQLNGTPTVLVQNNLFVGGGSVYSGSGPVTQTTNLATNSPGFVNQAGGNYHLAAGSAAIDAGSNPGSVNGVNLTPQFQYVAPLGEQARPVVGPLDIGAYEFGTGVAAPNAPTGLAATAGNGQVALTWAAASGASSYTVYRGTSSTSLAQLTAGVTSTSYTDSTAANGTKYYYQVTAVNSGGQSGPSNQVSATPQAPATLPSPWKDGDIGSPGLTGSASASNGTFTVNGGGGDIWGTADQFNYAYQAVSGNVTIVARVASQQNTDPWAKAGVMVRDSLAANGANAFVATTPGNGTDFQFRTADGAAAQWNGQVSAAAPEWVKLVVTGTTATGYTSPDGVTWTQIGSTTLPLGSTYYVGLADTAHNNGLLSKATFDNVRITSGTGAVVGTGTGLTGQYYSDTNLTNLVLTRTDPTVNFTWPNDTAPVTGLPADNWSVKWTGQVQAQYSEAYTFSTVSDDGVRLYVNGQLVINDWTYHGATTDTTAPIQLVAGQKYSIEMDFFEGGGAATAQLYWSSASTARQAVPTSQLYAAPAQAAAVNLAGSFNRVGLVNDGSTFSGGLDGGGAALSATLLGGNVTWGGQNFALGAAGANNVVAAQGQTIALPQGNFSSLMFLADAVNGNQPNQSFTVHYTDGTSQTITQSFSDWYTPQNYAGESVAAGTSYRNLGNGTKQTGPFNVYGYKFALNSAKTVQSITLPSNANLDILAMKLVP